jgi:hypothetical protein
MVSAFRNMLGPIPDAAFDNDPPVLSYAQLERTHGKAYMDWLAEFIREVGDRQKHDKSTGLNRSYTRAPARIVNCRTT